MASGDTTGLQSSILQKIIPGTNLEKSLADPTLEGMISSDGKAVSQSDFVDRLNATIEAASNSSQDANSTTTTRTLSNQNWTKSNSKARKAAVNAIEMSQNEGTATSPGSASDLKKTAIALHNEKKLNEAIAVYLQAIKLEPRRVSLHKNLALAYYQNRNYPAAWRSVSAVETLGGSISPQLLSYLQAKLPDPR